MILIGLTGWGDHDDLYQFAVNPRDKLKIYSSHFPIVEVDSSFYAIQSSQNYLRWAKETPESFQFVVKAFQGMTGHTRGDISRYSNAKEMFQLFIQSIQPLIEAKKLKMILFQYPPWFDCSKKNVEILRYTKEWMKEIPCALEFRHQSWFREGIREKTLEFMRSEGWIHSICDEPQAGEGSIPTVLEATNSDCTLIRFHGRNYHGWRNQGQANWRDVRYLYCYNEAELEEWKQNLLTLQTQSKELCVLFNNNSGGDAAKNAKQFITMLGIDYMGLHPRQLGLFEGES